MSNRQERNARKAAVRAGGKTQQFIHQQPLNPGRYLTRNERYEKRREEREALEAAVRLSRPVRDAVTKALGNIKKS